MNKPVLVVMAAGMGSRYGGLKQIDPVDREGDLIIDFSIFDAVEAGFEKVVFIIKKSIEKEFKEHIGNRMEKHVQVEYVYQENDRLPDGFEVPEGRVKPWGTGHAILCCSEVIDGPFAVINADDYYGKSAFKAIYDRLASCGDGCLSSLQHIDGKRPCGARRLYSGCGWTSGGYPRENAHREARRSGGIYRG